MKAKTRENKMEGIGRRWKDLYIERIGPRWIEEKRSIREKRGSLG